MIKLEEEIIWERDEESIPYKVEALIDDDRNVIELSYYDKKKKEDVVFLTIPFKKDDFIHIWRDDVHIALIQRGNVSNVVKIARYRLYRSWVYRVYIEEESGE